MHDNSSIEFDGKYWQMPASSSNERTIRSSREEVAYQQTTLDIDNSSSDDSDNSNVALPGVRRKYDTEMILPSYYCNSISTRDLSSAVPFGESLNEVVTCKLCNTKKYQNLLPCGHSFCLDCIMLHQKEKPSVEIKHGRKRMKAAAQENKMYFECISCLEPHELPFKYNLKNKIIYDLLDVMNQIDNPCPVHPYLTRNVKCIPCGSENICPMW
jgi:hypothetical protein